MPFDEGALVDALSRALDDVLKNGKAEPGVPPNVSRRAAEGLSNAYDSYVARNLGSIAPLVPVVSPQPSSMFALMTRPLLAGWGPAFAAYWTPVAFSAPGLIPANPVDPSSVAQASAQVSAGIAAMVSNPSMPKTTREAAQRMAAVLHGATVQLRFIATTTVGAVAPAPIP